MRRQALLVSDLHHLRGTAGHRPAETTFHIFGKLLNRTARDDRIELPCQVGRVRKKRPAAVHEG